MTYILALCIPITAMVVGFLVLKSVQLGLKWQMETKKDETPSPVVENPIKPLVQAKKEEQAKNEQEQIFQEWLYGANESR